MKLRPHWRKTRKRICSSREKCNVRETRENSLSRTERDGNHFSFTEKTRNFGFVNEKHANVSGQEKHDAECLSRADWTRQLPGLNFTFAASRLFILNCDSSQAQINTKWPFQLSFWSSLPTVAYQQSMVLDPPIPYRIIWDDIHE